MEITRQPGAAAAAAFEFSCEEEDVEDWKCVGEVMSGTNEM